TNDIIFTMGTSNIAIVPTNIVASASRKVVRVGIKQSAAGFGTCTTNLSQYPRMIRIGTTVTGFNLSTNGGYWDVFSLYTLNTKAILSGNLLGFEPLKSRKSPVSVSACVCCLAACAVLEPWGTSLERSSKTTGISPRFG